MKREIQFPTETREKVENVMCMYAEDEWESGGPADYSMKKTERGIRAAQIVKALVHAHIGNRLA